MAATFDTLTAGQCRRGRELLGWSQERLAGEAGLIAKTIGTFERGISRPQPATDSAIRRALESAGVVFRGSTGVEMAGEATGEEAILLGAEVKAS